MIFLEEMEFFRNNVNQRCARVVLKLTISHFFPSLVNTGGLFAAGAGALLPGDGKETGVLNGAGPARKAVFLCVCISEVTFFRPAKKTFRRL